MDHDDDFDPALAARLRSAAADLEAAGAERDRARPPSLLGRRSSAPGPRRARAVLAAAAVLAAVAVGAVALRSTDDGDDRVTTEPATEPCRSGDDLWAATSWADIGVYDVVVGGAGLEPRKVDRDWVATEPTLSPDGRHVVVVRAEGDDESAGPDFTYLWQSELDGRAGRPLTSGTGDDSPEYSPDGTTIAYARHESAEAPWQLALLPAEGGAPVVRYESARSNLANVTWSPDGRQLAFTERIDDRTEIVVVDAAGGTPRRLAPIPAPMAVTSLAWSPDGRWLLRENDGAGLDRIDLATGRIGPVLGDAHSLRWSADGTRVLGLDRASGMATLGHFERDRLVTDQPLPGAGGVARPTALAVGPCFAGGAPTPGPSGPDRPLLGTDWRHGPERLAFRADTDAPACQGYVCETITITATDADGCASEATATYGTDRIAIDALNGPGATACREGRRPWLTERASSTYEVEGDELRLTDGDGTTTTYGAFYVGEPPTPLPVAAPTATTGPAGTATPTGAAPTSTTVATVPGTTVPATPTRPSCSAIEAFAERVVDIGISYDRDVPASPEGLAAQVDAVLAGTLVGTLTPYQDATAELGGASYLAYDVLVTEVLRPGDTAIEPGDVVPILVAWNPVPDPNRPRPVSAFEDALAPARGAPVVVFPYVQPGAPAGGLVAGSMEFVLGCPGGPLIGAVSTAGTWPEVRDLDDLADRVRTG